MDEITILSYFPEDNRLESMRSRGRQEVSAELKQTIEESGIFEQMIKNNAEVTATIGERVLDVSRLKTTRVTDYNPATQ